MIRIIILTILLAVGLIVNGCASKEPTPFQKSSQRPDYKNTTTGEIFYSKDNDEFMKIQSECIQKAQRAVGNQSKYQISHYIDICLSGEGYEKVYYRGFRKPSALSY